MINKNKNLVYYNTPGMDTIARPVKRGRPQNSFNLKDFTKKDAQELGFATKQLALKFLKTTKYSESDAAKILKEPKSSNNHNLSKYKSVDELKDFIKKRKALLGDDIIESLYKPKSKKIKLTKKDKTTNNKKHKITKKRTYASNGYCSRKTRETKISSNGEGHGRN